MQNPALPQTPAQDRLRRALEYLTDETTGNPLVRHTLTCFERELARNDGDAFPRAAGAGALPIMAWDDQSLRDAGQQVTIGQPQPRELNRRPITGVLQTVIEPQSDATLQQNAAQHHTVGERRMRNQAVTQQQPLIAETPGMAVGNALHPTLYHTGRGAWHKTDTACDEAHFRKLRLASINPNSRSSGGINIASSCPAHSWKANFSHGVMCALPHLSATVSVVAIPGEGEEVDARLRTAHGQPTHRANGHSASTRPAGCTAGGQRRRQSGDHAARELQRPRAKDAE